MKKIDLSSYKRIAISGCHKIGKTTLCNKIRNYVNTKIVPEFAIDLINLNPSSFDEGQYKEEDTYRQYLLECAIIYSHMYAVSIMPSFVSDRSILDALAYTYYFHQKGMIDKNGFIDINTSTKEFVDNWNMYYDKILVFNLYNSYASTDISKELRTFQEIIDTSIKELSRAYLGELTLINKGDILLFDGIGVMV